MRDIQHLLALHNKHLPRTPPAPLSKLRLDPGEIHLMPSATEHEPISSPEIFQ